MTEGIGILLLVPLLGLLQSDQLGATESSVTQTIADILAAIGLPLTAGVLLGLFLGLVVFRNLVQFTRGWYAARFQHQLTDNLRRDCFEALLHTEWRRTNSGRQSDHASLLLTDVSRVDVSLNASLSLLAGSATMAAYIAATFVLSWQMTLIAVFSGDLVFLLLAGQRRRTLGLDRDLSGANKGIHQVVQESLAGMKLTKILGNEKRHLEQFEQVIRRLREKQEHYLASEGLSRALYQTGGALLLVIYLYLGLGLLQLPIAELLILVLVFGRLIPQFASAQQQYHHCLHALPALDETRRLLTDCRLHAEPQGASDTAPRPLSNTICLDRARVRYPERKWPALDGISVCFTAHTTTAIMGGSGAGKSTLADVLMGLLALDEGHLLVDDKVIAGKDRIAWRHSVADVPQEVFLFNDSIRNNLLWGWADASEEELRFALQRAAADFVLDLPRQLDTPVGDGGIRLSGGERQRLALAHALLKKPSLLILDEATSALDRAINHYGLKVHSLED